MSSTSTPGSRIRICSPALLEFRELASRAAPVPAPGPAAKGLDAVDALLMAAVHRAAHHYGSN